jgi:hypothetical protein
MRQSTSRQRAWFNSFQVWLVCEVFVISSGLVLVEHVLIPLWSLKEVQRVKEQIVSDILKYQSKLKSLKSKSSGVVKGKEANGTKEGKGTAGKSSSKDNKTCEEEDEEKEVESDPRSFNAAEFLFPSYRIARLFPEYSESQLILQYKTPWPKKSFKGGGEKSMRKRYDKRFEFIPKTIGRVGVFVLSNLIQLPPSIQDMGLQMALLTLCGYVLKFHVMLFEINPLLSGVPSLMLATVVYVLLYSGSNRRVISSTYPAAQSHEHDSNDGPHSGKIDSHPSSDPPLQSAHLSSPSLLSSGEHSSSSSSLSDLFEISSSSDENDSDLSSHPSFVSSSPSSLFSDED